VFSLFEVFLGFPTNHRQIVSTAVDRDVGGVEPAASQVRSK
jgi:hypothetical protein